VAALCWLHDGENSVGFGRSWDVEFPGRMGSGRLGVFTLVNKRVSWTPVTAVAKLPGMEASTSVKSDKDGDPRRFPLGEANFWLIERGERVGVRLRDPNAPERRMAHDLPVFPYSDRWRVSAVLMRNAGPAKRRIVDVTGNVADYDEAGVLEFEAEGDRCRLTALEDKEAGDLWLLFRDKTSGGTTYGSGRFLHVKKPGPGGATVIDFNYAYTPPCGYTKYATCPLPPPENQLPVRVDAGEKKPH
jgi:uncharacterized protein